MLYTLRAMGAYNDGSQWANVNIYSNVINIRRTSTSGIFVGLFNVAHIYGNTFEYPENPDQNNPIYLFAYGIDASINNELEINDNSFYGPYVENGLHSLMIAALHRLTLGFITTMIHTQPI
jgi:hypothetical protein